VFYQEQARALRKVKLEITVYYTARKPVTVADEGQHPKKSRDSTWDASETMYCSASKRDSSLDGVSDMLEKETQNDSDSALGSADMQKEKDRIHNDMNQATPYKKEETVGTHEEVTDEKDQEMKQVTSSKKEDTVELHNDITEEDNTPGFPMEVARFMVGRFSKFYFNIPVLFAFNLSVWCGFSIIFETYDWNQMENFKQMSATMIFTLVMTVMFVVFGFLAEGTVLHLRKHWPSPTFDDFVLYLPSNDTEKGGKKWSLVESEYSILKTARNAEAPGIFTCGPAQMMDMVRYETNQENTWLGRTRFCLYDEPFEF
jgi:hypothetical protein